jgi:membrane dipeptidase
MFEQIPVFRTITVTMCLFVQIEAQAQAISDSAAIGDSVSDMEAHITELLESAPIVDAHNDLPAVIRSRFDSDVEGYDISHRAKLDTDIPRLRAGLVGTQFWSVYVASDVSTEEALRRQLEQIDIARRIISNNSNDLGFSTSVAEIEAERRSGRIASLLGIEGGHTIGNSLGVLRAYYLLGVRYITLTHYHSTDWADSATDKALHNGLTDFGREVVREINRLGMMVDLSHVSPETMQDVLQVTRAPVIFSHSAARNMTDHERNVPDSILRMLVDNNGVIMVPFIPIFVSEEVRLWRESRATTPSSMKLVAPSGRKEEDEVATCPRATVADVADHIEYIAHTFGVNHVGIGADFYGAETECDLVEGLEDVSKYPALFVELLRRGWSDADLIRLARGNMLRVFADVEIASSRLRAVLAPSLATIDE